MNTLMQETIYLPDAPAIPGLIFRGFAGESDFPKMLAVIEASKNVDQIERTDSLVDVARLLPVRKGFPMLKNARLPLFCQYHSPILLRMTAFLGKVVIPPTSC